MNIGYPCLNYTLKPLKNLTFRLNSYSEERFISTVENNLLYLEKILEYNIKHGFLFLRISSDIIPFASHPICKVKWQKIFADQILELGKIIQKNKIRISMHPSQFVLINATTPSIIKNSIADLKWHCELLDLMNLDSSAKVQIHVGGAYGDKKAAIKRFIDHYQKLDISIKNRLVIENDDRIFHAQDCLDISEVISIPIIFDNLHHECNNQGEDFIDVFEQISKTWNKKDGVPMLDYSSQEPNERVGKHAASIDIHHFKNYLKQILNFPGDIMLEIKDKELSAKKAMAIYSSFIR